MDGFDINKAPLEIERKFLIEYPDIEELRAMPDYRRVHIEQSYLEADGDFIGGRIRRITDEGGIRYVYTYKQRLSDMTRREYEREISKDEYERLLSRKAADTVTVVKDRHSFGYMGLIYELDVYEFWDKTATLEAEVESEDTPIPMPPCVRLIKEVTHDRRYNNSMLARSGGIITD